MSLVYALFGKPRTIEEFADKARRERLNAKVWVGAYAEDPALGTIARHCVYLVAGETALEYFRAKCSIGNEDPLNPHLNEAARSQALAKAGEAHAILTRAGIEARLHNHYNICELVA